MSRVPSLTAVVSRIRKRQSSHLSEESALARAAGRGHLAHESAAAQLEPWQRGLLAALGLAPGAHASAPTTALGAGHAIDARDWWHAEPIHLAAGLNEVTLVPLSDDAALTREELVELSPVLTQHFAASGVRLHASRSGWLLESSRRWDVQTVTAEFARRREWHEVLPQGADAGALRRLMTEIQMVLHEHAVNDRRRARGVPDVNALWFWGNGPIAKQGLPHTVACVGDNDYLAGICRMQGWDAPAPLGTAEALPTQARGQARVLAVIEADDWQEIEARWVVPLIDALKEHRIAKLELIIDEWRLAIDRWQWRRFWRRARAPEHWAVA